MIDDDINKRLLNMTPTEIRGEERRLELNVKILKMQLEAMTQLMTRLRSVERDIEYRKQELDVLENQKSILEKEAAVVFATT